MEILGLVDISLTWILIIMVFVCLYIYETWHFSTWSDLGIPGPKPILIFGNVPENKERNMLVALDEWRRKYGNTYGLFYSREPLFVTSEPDMVKEVMVKQFNKFTHRFSGFDRLMDDFDLKMLFSSNGAPWKRYRHLMTPAFSTGKLKALQGYIVKCSHILTSVLKDKAAKQEDIDLKDLYTRFTMDVIAGTEFGLDTNLQTGDEVENHEMISAMKNILANFTGPYAALLATAFPALAPLMRRIGYSAFPKKDLDFFRDCIRSLVRQRDQNPQESKQRVDFLQQMMNLRVEPGQEVSDLDNESSANKSNKRVTEEEVQAQGIQIFNAGFETTASTLRYLTHALATNPEVQDKLYQEIQDVVGDGDVTYEKLQQLKYMDNVIRETLRTFPIVPNISRRAMETVTIKGFTIPKGAGVLIPIYTATHDPDIFPEPDEFRPERFTENPDNLMALLPFGAGPRQCIGMRLALLEIKTAVVHVLRDVRFVPCENTPENVEFLPGSALLVTKIPLIVRTEARS